MTFISAIPREDLFFGWSEIVDMEDFFLVSRCSYTWTCRTVDMCGSMSVLFVMCDEGLVYRSRSISDLGVVDVNSDLSVAFFEASKSDHD